MGVVPSSSPAGTTLPWLHAIRGSGARFADADGRQVLFHGVNVAQLNQYGTYNAHPPDAPPLTLDDFRQMRALGLNNVRLLIAWSRLEPRPGQISASYLDTVAQAVRWASDEGIYVVLDMHQDAYSPFVKAPDGTVCPPGAEPQRGWDGAPAWATITDGLLACAPGGVRDFAPNSIQAFNNLWVDRPAADGTGIQTRLVAAWQALAKRFADQPAVAGFDLINEPHPGSSPNGDAATITRFYDRAIPAIRLVDSRHIIFIEPEVTRSAVSDGVVVPPPRADDANLAYAPHDYGDLAFGVAQDREFTNAEREASEAGGTGGALPIWFGEFPMLDTPDGGRAYNSSWQQLADQHIVGWSHWVWKETCGNPHTNYGPVPPSTVISYDCAHDRFTTVKATRVPYLSSPYPAFAPGRLTAFSFDPTAKSLHLAATSADPKAGGPLELILPSAHFGSDPAAVRPTATGLADTQVTRRDDGNLILTASAVSPDWTLDTRGGSPSRPAPASRPTTQRGRFPRRRPRLHVRRIGRRRIRITVSGVRAADVVRISVLVDGRRRVSQRRRVSTIALTVSHPRRAHRFRVVVSLRGRRVLRLHTRLSAIRPRRRA